MSTVPQHHVMRREKTHATGTEEWFCPTCLRRFLLQWEPTFKRIIMVSGDEHAIHSGGTGGLQVEPARTDDMSEALRNALSEVLDDIDFGDWPVGID